MRILVTGAGGMLGGEIMKVFSKHELIAPEPIYLDVRNYDQVMSFEKHKPDFIFHLAAATDHIACEFNPADAYMTNTIGTFNMVRLAESLNIPILYMSTGGIFDGEQQFYTEWDLPNPVNHYSRSKYYGEMAIKEYSKHYIVRAGWMMGGGLSREKKFVGKIFKKIQSEVRQIHAINDVFGSPTYATDLAKEIKNIIKMPAGIYHCANSGRASRYDVAVEFIKCLGLEKEVTIIPKTFLEYYRENKLLCPYTKNEVVESTILLPMRCWQDALKEYAEKEFVPCLQRTF